MSKKNKGRKYYVIYQVTNLLNRMIYIGKRGTHTPYDLKNYWGGSKWLKKSIKKNGKKNFHRETLFVFETEGEAYAKEKEIVTPKFVAREDTYNLREGGEGGWKSTESTRKKISNNHANVCGGNNPNYGKTGQDCAIFGLKQTKETKIKNAITHLGEEVFYQRLKDIEEIDRVYGFKAKLARKWSVTSSTVGKFIKKWRKE